MRQGYTNDWRTVASATEPSVKTKTAWLELSGNVPLYGWPWFWNGTYWLSPLQKISRDVGGATGYTALWLPLDQRFDVYFVDVRGSLQILTTADSSNRWDVALSRRSSSGSDTTISSGFSANTTNPSDYSQSINTHVDVSATSAKICYLSVTPVGSPGALFGAIEVGFHFARL